MAARRLQVEPAGDLSISVRSVDDDISVLLLYLGQCLSPDVEAPEVEDSLG